MLNEINTPKKIADFYILNFEKEFYIINKVKLSFSCFYFYLFFIISLIIKVFVLHTVRKIPLENKLKQRMEGNWKVKTGRLRLGNVL